MIKLYSYYQSSASYRVRIALNFKKLAYDYVAVDLTKNEQQSDEFSKLNKMMEVPLLESGNTFQLAQSVAIFLWLDQTYPDPKLFPGGPEHWTQILQFCEYINSGIHPLQNLKVRREIKSRYGADDVEVQRWCGHWIEHGFRSVEEFLKKSSGKYCFGDEITAADMFLIPQVFNADRFKVNLSSFPTIKRINEACLKVEAFKKAHPLQQPDAPV